MGYAPTVRPTLLLALAVPLLAAACADKPAPPASARATISAANGQWSVTPTAGQLPYCLVIESRGSEVVRPLPLSEEGQSVPCAAGAPIAGKTWPQPTRDIGLKAFIVFSDRPLKADSVADQIRSRLDEGPHAVVTSMDLRAPGQVSLETLDIPPTK